MFWLPWLTIKSFDDWLDPVYWQDLYFLTRLD